ncbi:MAG TPA: hypothetical protein VIQ77_00425 [Mucilaginibacter sp.]|jgi:hypothetical protein
MNQRENSSYAEVTEYPERRIIPLKKKDGSTPVIDVLKKELASAVAVIACEDRIVILVRNAEYERLGNLLHQLQQAIEQYCPDRQSHLSIVVRNEDKPQENVFKIWKPA